MSKVVFLSLEELILLAVRNFQVIGFISEQLAKQLENCCVSNGDLVFPHRGSIGEVGLVDNQFHQYMMSSSLMKLRCNPNIADSEFIYYF